MNDTDIDNKIKLDLEEINTARIFAGLKPLVIRTKNCQICKKDFTTTVNSFYCVKCKQIINRNYYYV